MLTESEMETKFANFALQFSLDAKTLNARYHHHCSLQTDVADQLDTAVQNLLTCLNQIQQVCKEVMVQDPVSNCLQQLGLVIRLSSHVSALAMQCGTLQEEQRLLRSFSLIINYTRLLKLRAEDAIHPLGCIRWVLGVSFA